jgi:hypothetical protein
MRAAQRFRSCNISSKESEHTLVLQPIPSPIRITMTNAIIESILSRSTTKKYDPAVTLSDDQITASSAARTQRLVAGIALLMVCASFTGARSGRGSPAADDEHRWHKGPVDGTAVLGPSTATPLSPLLPPGTGRIAVQPT